MAINLGELVTTTERYRDSNVADNVSNSIALLKRLMSKGNMKLIPGGRTIIQPLDYNENSTFQYYSGYDTFSVAASDVLDAAEYSWKQAVVSVTMSGLEEIQNSGKEAVINWLSARLKNADRTMKNNIGSGVYADGTGSGSKEIGGLQLIVADTNTNSVGGIDANTYSFWQNVSYDASSDGGAAASSSNIQDYMNAVYVQLVRGNEGPDLIIADNNYWKFYLKSLQAIQVINDDSFAQAGFKTLDYMGAPVVLDGGQGGNCPSNHMYFLNTDYLFFYTHKDRNFVRMGKREATNQDAMIKPMFWAGNLACSNRSLQGVLKA